MSEVVEAKVKPDMRRSDHEPASYPTSPARAAPPPSRKRGVGQVLLTVLVVAIAVLLGRAMWDAYMGAPWTRDAVVPAVASAMPAFELIEDRHADYNATDASSLIVENCWNGGIVLGNPQPVQAGDLVGIAGRLSISGKTVGEGNAEDPYATLAWVANHLAERGRDLKAGMVVITGSVIPTVSIASGDRALFTVDKLGEVAMEVA